MMSQAIKEENVYAEAFRELQERTDAQEPSWLKRLRENAFERFEELGFPTPKHEEWKDEV
jgi:Fe-S cluster assembly protein SufD